MKALKNVPLIELAAEVEKVKTQFMASIKLVLILLFITTGAVVNAQQTLQLSELTVTHTQNQDKGFAIIGKLAIPYVTTSFSTKTPVTFTNIYGISNGVNQVEYREIYYQACSQCYANYIYYYGGENTVMRMWELNADGHTYKEINNVHKIGSVLVAAK
jgi:hypothetical protein